MAIAKNGGVIQVNFYSGFLDSNYMKNRETFINRHKAEWDSVMTSTKADFRAEGYLADKYPTEVQVIRAPFDLLIENIEYIIKLVGIDYVGLGSDFDGIEAPLKQLDDVTTYPLITRALLVKQIAKKIDANFGRKHDESAKSE